ncbi:MAG: foldase protein PrsA [Flavobacteriales bacterium]
MKKTLLLLSILFSCNSYYSFAQNGKKIMIDKVISVVAEQPIYLSEFEDQISQYKAQGSEITDELKAYVFEDMMNQKLYLYKAQLDSIIVDDAEVNGQIERRISYFEQQLGGRAELEKQFKKTREEIMEDMRDPLREQLLAQRAKWAITDGISLTPGEIKDFYHTIPQDSLPMVDDQLQIGQILKYPKPSATAIDETKKKLNDLKKRIVEGESFATLAILYSEDPGSSNQGGLYKGIKRGMFVKEFEEVMFSLEVGQISDPFKTEYGYHILKLEGRTGEVVDVRHILISPTIDVLQLTESNAVLDSIKNFIEDGKYTFAEAALEYSDDKATKQNSGLLINPTTQTTFFEIEKMERTLSSSIQGLELETVSKPQYIKLPDGKEAYRLLYIFTKKEKHRLNIKDDYQSVQNMATLAQEEEAMAKWKQSAIEDIYIRIDKDFEKLPLKTNWKTK